jgi:hypothetical protein
MSDAFDTADYYSTSEDAETLEYEDPTSAIENLVDSWSIPNEPIEKALNDVGDVTVYAWKRSTIPDAQWSRWADNLADRFEEDYDESEYANPDDRLFDQRSQALRTSVVASLTDALKKAMEEQEVWHCEVSAKRTYTRAEVEAMMREENPEWFTGER